MAPSGFATFLLSLGLVVSNVNGDNTTALCDKILTTALSNASLPEFNLTVSPDKLHSSTSYTVQVHGSGNFAVLLQALTVSSPVGSWSPGNNSCNESVLFTDHFLNNSVLSTTWTSPANVTNVTIKAFIHNDTYTFLLHQTLSQESATNTTIATPTANTTQSTNVTAATNTTESTKVTAVTPVKTTSTGSVAQFSLLSMALSVILGLLLNPSNFCF
ncbi:placenta-expressed transcript 1 protein-like [Dendropsophus ebraccatus]|uniref:placenta-expressed transcript 1 protein-like n=1 Tax=Dendropsophus ebraccatus TaxID=150705 RepID=UPI00383206D0